jgi:Zn-dependent protease with chaperone function
MQASGRRHATAPILAGLAQRASEAIVVPVAILACRLWLGDWWPACAVAVLAVLAARRELTRLYFAPMPAALREALAQAPHKDAQPLRDLARRSGIVAPAVLFWPVDWPPYDLLAIHYVIQGRPIFLLSDTLRVVLSPAEVRSVFAHELAHHLLQHVKRMAVALAAADVLAGAVACIAAVNTALPAGAGWPLALQAAKILLVWAGARACLQVALNALGRRQELQADRKALQLTGDREAFLSASRKLAARRGAEKEPPRLLHWLLADAPTLRQRLAAAERGQTSSKSGDGTR